MFDLPRSERRSRRERLGNAVVAPRADRLPPRLKVERPARKLVRDFISQVSIVLWSSEMSETRSSPRFDISASYSR